MRKVRHLEYVDYVIPIGQKTSQVIPLSCNYLLQKTWNKAMRDTCFLRVHAKFNSETMNGFSIVAYLNKNGRVCSSANGTVTVYRVSETSWDETQILTGAMTQSGLLQTKTYLQSDLSANELSGRETYAIQVTVQRKRQMFREKIYFNHLGVYDHLLVLRREIETLYVKKAGE